MEDIVDMAAKAAQNPPASVHRIQPSPLPTVFNVGQADVGGQNFVLLQVTTPSGQAIYFLDGNAAEDVGTALIRLGQASQAGLIVP